MVAKKEEEAVTEEGRLLASFRARNLGQLWFFSIMISWGMWLAIYTYFAEYKILQTDDDDAAVVLTTHFSMMYAACQFAGNPVLGAVSDGAVGKRRIMLVGAVSYVVGWPLLAIFPRPRIFLILAAVTGLCDATPAVVKASAADFAARDDGAVAGSSRFDWPLARICYMLIRPTHRTTTSAVTTELAVMNAHSIAGMMVGLVCGELAYKYVGLKVAVACQGLVLVPATIAIALLYPEPTASSRPARFTGAASQSHFASSWEENNDDNDSRCQHVPACWRPAAPADPARRGPFALSVVAYICLVLGLQGMSSVILYYVEDRAGMGSLDVAGLILEAIVVAPFSSFMALRYLVPRLGFRHSFTTLALVCGTGSFCVAVIPRRSNALLVLFLTVFFVGYGILPLSIGPLSSEVQKRHQGRLQGQLYAINVAATLAGSELFLKLYTNEPRSPFFCTFACAAAAALLFFFAGDPSALGSGIDDEDDDDSALNTTSSARNPLLERRKSSSSENIFFPGRRGGPSSTDRDRNHEDPGSSSTTSGGGNLRANSTSSSSHSYYGGGGGGGDDDATTSFPTAESRRSQQSSADDIMV